MGIQNLESNSASKRSSLRSSTTSAALQIIETNNSFEFHRELLNAGREIACLIEVKNIHIGA